MRAFGLIDFVLLLSFLKMNKNSSSFGFISLCPASTLLLEL